MNILFHDGNRINFYKGECENNVLSLWFGDGFGIDQIRESIKDDNEKIIYLNTDNNISIGLKYKSMRYNEENPICTIVRFDVENII